MGGYTKLFSSIVASTIWRESKEVKVLWVTLLAMADRTGKVDASVPGLADMARLTVPETQEALEILQAPDPFSRSPEYEGRRIKAVEGGFIVLNYLKYRESRDPDIRREQNRQAAERWRKKSKPKVSQNKPESAHADAESREQIAEADHTRPAPSAPDAKEEPANLELHSPKPGNNQAAKPHPRDPLFDALARSCGSNPLEMPSPQARACAVALAAIRKVCPTLTPEEIASRAATYQRIHKDWTLTPNALANHWGECGASALPSIGPKIRGRIDRTYKAF